ncbi:MAG: hypothetical protein WD046_07145 [Paracoccaceae bacterium]
MKTYYAALALSALPLAAVQTATAQTTPAQTTPAAVLAEWQALDDAMGFFELSYVISTETSEFIRLDDLVITSAMDFGFGNLNLTATLGWVELRARGDGTVAMSEADTIIMEMDTTAAMAGEVTRSQARSTMQLLDASTVISGTAGAHIYSGQYGEIQVVSQQTNWFGDGDPVKTSDTQLHTGVVYTYTTPIAPMGMADFSYSVENSTLSTSIPLDPAFGAALAISTEMTITGQQDEGQINLAAFAGETLDLSALDITLNSTIAGMTLEMEGAGTQVSMAFGASTGSFALNAQHGAFAIDISDWTQRNTFMGVPVNFSFDRFAIDASAPLGPRHRMGTSRVVLDIEGFALDEELMAMMDPSSALGRGPINLSLSAEAQTSALFDLANPVDIETMEPPELRTFRFDIAGEYTDFNFTADGSGQMQNDMPIGTGQASVTNLQSMLQRLATAGLISSFDVSLAQGMIAAMFTPGPAPGSLRSSFEMRADGTIWVNGAQMQ